MNREERQAMRQRLAHWKERHCVEVQVAQLRALLDECDRLEDLADAQGRLLDSYIARCGT